jgi:anaerobic magnesium-protoporphyrin IX monomethyl ester cyclase
MTLDGWLRTPARYPGIYSRRKQDPGVIMSKPKPSDAKSLNLLPVPDRSDYAHAKYRRFWMEREGVSLATLMTSYGCPFDCEFCSKPIFGSRFRRRAMDHIFEEIRDVKTWGYNGLWIADDCFSLLHANDIRETGYEMVLPLPGGRH